MIEVAKIETGLLRPKWPDVFTINYSVLRHSRAGKTGERW
jgi:hypothetical protein